jgi:CRISPR-associated endonuclease Csn1
MAREIQNVLGIDIGTESVGSAWVDLEANDFDLAASIFPRGIEESDRDRGAPKNQARRMARSQRRSIARRSTRKKQLRRILVNVGLYPLLNQSFDHDVRRQTPWELRRDGLRRPLTPHEFGRVLIHLNQRRGALGIHMNDGEDADEQETKADQKDAKAKEQGNIKKAISRLEDAIGERTFGQFMADKYDEQHHKTQGTKEVFFYRSAIRNRRDALNKDQGYHATRELIRKEFLALWDAQKKLGGATAALLTDELKEQLENPAADEKWREQGTIFGQRKTYWNTGTLGRCDLEPSAHDCPHADMYVQEFRVLETVNNILVRRCNEEKRQLNETERKKVIAKLRSQKTGSPKTIRTALGVTKKQEPFFWLNLDNDPDREINTDWFYGEIVLPVFGEEAWEAKSERERDSVNRALLKFDPDTTEHVAELAAGAKKWWNLSAEKVQLLIEAWQNRPKLEKRANLSRLAIQNLLPLMRAQDQTAGRWLTVTEARKRFAEDPASRATPDQRVRYALAVTDTLRKLLRNLVGEDRANALLRIRGTNKHDRHYIKRHPEKILPPAPMLANPVVRKAIHEVRRHVIAWIRRFGRKPDQIVVELISEARQSAKVRNQILARNRFRERIRKEIKKQFSLDRLSSNQQEAAVDRVILLRQQRGLCAYTHPSRAISEQHAVEGTDLEIDHIIPKSLSRDSGLSNKVLCYKNANQSKGQRTPKTWLPPDQYTAMLQRLGHLEKGKPEKGDYFSKKENARKWKNLTSDTPDTSDFLASQYTDTAYAAQQVREWLAGVLYGDEENPDRRVVPTNGRVTSALRKDWQLQDAAKLKDRGDHRHHALDALVIALSNLNLQAFVASLDAHERFHEKYPGQWPPREPVEPPWGTVQEFRAQVFEKFNRILVVHRPVKRKLVGELHKANPLGKAKEYPGLFTFHIPASELAPNKLRPPKKNVAKDGTITYSIEGKGQTSVVRDPALREAIRQCLRNNNLDPDSFTEKEMEALTKPNDYRLCFPTSGRPIYNITMVCTVKDPIKILRRDNVERYYRSMNNHHVEVLEDLKTKTWEFDCVDMFTAAKCVKPPRGQERQPMVSRKERQNKRFVMSLAEGETIFMKNPPPPKGSTRSEEYDYFVVAKIDENKVHVIHHTDARSAKARKNPRTGLLEDPRELISLTANQLQEYASPAGKPPKKVRVLLPGYRNVPESVLILKND